MGVYLHRRQKMSEDTTNTPKPAGISAERIDEVNRMGRAELIREIHKQDLVIKELQAGVNKMIAPYFGEEIEEEKREEELMAQFSRLQGEGIIKTYDVKKRETADSFLKLVFMEEYTDLPAAEKMLIVQDFLEAVDRDRTDRLLESDYAKYIGKGNLESYSKTQVCRLKNGWK